MVFLSKFDVQSKFNNLEWREEKFLGALRAYINSVFSSHKGDISCTKYLSFSSHMRVDSTMNVRTMSTIGMKGSDLDIGP